MKPKIKKIQPYFFGLTDKLRLIVYLLGTGKYSFDQLRRLTIGEVKEWRTEIQRELELNDILSDICFNKGEDEVAFTRPSGSEYSVKAVIDILKRAHKIAKTPYGGLQPFVECVTGKNK